MRPGLLQTGRYRWVLKLARLFVAGVVLGLAYHWAAPRLYRPEVIPGFWLGAAHGALMPVALPSLLAGQDVPIYAERNLGRIYKLGYIAGINLCGLIFFGMAFWQPAPRPGRLASPPLSPKPPAAEAGPPGPAAT